MEREIYYVRQERELENKNKEIVKCRFRVGSITLIKDDEGKFHRGISILGMEDNFNRDVAVKISNARAMKALGTKMSSMAIDFDNSIICDREKAIARFLDACQNIGVRFSGVIYKSGYDVELCEFERRIFTKPV